MVETQLTIGQLLIECRLSIDGGVNQILIEILIEGINQHSTKDDFSTHDPGEGTTDLGEGPTFSSNPQKDTKI